MFDSTCLPLLKMACHNNVKTYNIFYQKNYMFYLAPFQSTFNDTINSYYIESGRTTMNYAKKVVIFISCTSFHKEYL